MLFLSFKLFIFILVLNIILGSNKNNNSNYESREFDLLYEELVKQKLKDYQRLMNLRKKEKNYEKTKLRDKKWQDKVVMNKIRAYYVLIGDYNKYYEMSDSFNLIEMKNKLKNKYYEMSDSFNLIKTKNKIKKNYTNIYLKEQVSGEVLGFF
ncbi:Hypotetical protein, putative [Plasmodium sp. gorilla clade G3]|nr:Hypotetical protein, putative [Plasmodium sp. gorilla clade G3]